jgi:hypothetical protein
VIGDDLKMRVPEMPLTRNGFPSFSIVHEIALFHAANCSGRCPQRQTTSARAAGPSYRSRSNFRQRAICAAMFRGAGTPDCSPRCQRAANVEQVRNIDIKQWGNLFSFAIEI